MAESEKRPAVEGNLYAAARRWIGPGLQDFEDLHRDDESEDDEERADRHK